MYRNIEEVIEICAMYLKANDKPITPTYLMWEVMNEVSDEELYEMDMTIIDVAEAVDVYCN